MVEDVIIEPMTQDFILWRCLHEGPVSSTTIYQWPSGSQLPWEIYRKRNIPLLTKLTRIYGACGILARDGSRVVGQLRFYPNTVCGMKGAGHLNLQQDYPFGPMNDFVDNHFSPLSRIEDKTLAVHCLMTGCPQQKENPYQRKGIGSRMAGYLIGWDRIEADSFEEIPVIYEMTGCAGHTFWKKLGFSITDRYPHPDL